MSYREFPPSTDLASHVACTWSDVGRAVTGAEAEPVIPDGCADIIVFGDEPPHVAGPAAFTQWVRPPPAGDSIAAIRLRPGAVRSVLRCDATQIGPWGIELAAICGRQAHPLLARLAASGDPLVRRQALEAWVRQRIGMAAGADRFVLAAADLLIRAPRPSIDAVTAALDMSPRQLHRGFVAACGYGPKTLQRIMRLQGALRIAAAPGAAVGLAQLAQAAGYSDQAHMTREFQRITGFTPSRYLPGLNPEVGRWLEP